MSAPLRLRHDLYMAPAIIKDPGYSASASARTITIDKDGGVCPVITTGTGDARTLRQPTKAGIVGTIVLYDDGGDLTLTVTGGYNNDDDTSITFDDAGDFVRFMSIDEGGTYYWRAIAQEGTTAVKEEGLFDTATITALTLDSTLLTVTGAELNQMTDAILDDMAPGTGISTGTGTSCVGKVIKGGGLFKTEILIDITGLNDGDTSGDVIGKDGDTVNCHIGRITDAKNGLIFFGQITCLEVPAGGDVDIDFWGSATVGTLAQDTAISAATGEIIMLNSGDWSAAPETPVVIVAGEPDAGYMYMATGSQGTDANYTSGIFLIELWGK